ncbi:hypothetical protein EYF80_025056 [Liparis tanakae]|uniref:Uncharacterized protein n=1 Tax=Liparis tanakae TaxID=230148 RepID=A0A4Z2HGT7_9TELE|nr:hypothetical protein EYF80_025056 [Liparis tanakae]
MSNITAECQQEGSQHSAYRTSLFIKYGVIRISCHVLCYQGICRAGYGELVEAAAGTFHLVRNKHLEKRKAKRDESKLVKHYENNRKYSTGQGLRGVEQSGLAAGWKPPTSQPANHIYSELPDLSNGDNVRLFGCISWSSVVLVSKWSEEST